jgi:uncharacterized cupin superfamily protein
MFVVNDNPVEYDFGGSHTRLLVSGEHTGNAYCVLEMSSPPGRATPMHEHAHEDETLVMLEGELDTVVNGERRRLRAGSSITFLRGTRHQLINAGDRTARYMVICAPAGFDRFVDACAVAHTGVVATREPDDEDKARMRAAAARFGITLHAPVAKA